MLFVFFLRQLSDTATWHHAVACFDHIAAAGGVFAGSLRGVAPAVSRPEHVALLRRSLVHLLAVQNSQPGSEGRRFFGMGPTFQRIFLSHFSPYNCLTSHLDHLAALMSQWQPTFIEFGLLQALVHFRPVPSTSRQLRMVLDWHMASQADGARTSDGLRFLHAVIDDVIPRFELDYAVVLDTLRVTRPELMTPACSGCEAKLHTAMNHD